MTDREKLAREMWEADKGNSFPFDEVAPHRHGDAYRQADIAIAYAERLIVEAAALCDCAVTDAFDALRSEKEEFGSDYDPNCYAAGYSNGEIAAYRRLAEDIRTLRTARAKEKLDAE